jgi:hypothetical protein
MKFRPPSWRRLQQQEEGVMSNNNNNVVHLGTVMREFTEVDGGKWALTESILNDPSEYRRLVRTQVEELFALYEQYPLPEFSAVRRVFGRATDPDTTAAGLFRC